MTIAFLIFIIGIQHLIHKNRIKLERMKYDHVVKILKDERDKHGIKGFVSHGKHEFGHEYE